MDFNALMNCSQRGPRHVIFIVILAKDVMLHDYFNAVPVRVHEFHTLFHRRKSHHVI